MASKTAALRVPSSPGTSSERLAYRPDIDGLRGIAVLAVVVFHAFPKVLPGGFVGVDIFFVISGYLITGIILKGLQANRFTFRHFYAGRIRRIFPALAVTLLAVYGIGRVVMTPDEFRTLGKHLAGGSVFVSNFILWREAGYFDANSLTKPLLHLWSLAVEEQFYLVWPTILFLAWKSPRMRLVGILTALSFALSLWWSYRDPAAAFYLCAARLWELLVGASLAFRSDLVSFLGAKVRAFLGLALVTVSIIFVNEGVRFPGYAVLLPTAGALLIISAGGETFINNRVLGSPGLVFVGLISYPLYLLHWPLLSFAFLMESGHPSNLIKLALVLVSFGLSWCVYRMIERPIRFGTPRASIVAGLCLLLAAVGFAGFRGEYTPGLHPTAATRKEVLEQLNFVQNRSSGCDRYSLRTADCIVTGEHPRVAVLGDSHAATLAVGLSHVLGPTTPLAYLGTGGCPALLNTLSHYKNDPSHCTSFTHRPEQIAEVVGDAPLVILTSREAWYLNTEDWYIEAKGFTGDRETVFADAYSKSISAIESMGRRALYVVDVPDLQFQPTDCVDTRPVHLTDFKPRVPCAISYQEHLTYTSRDRDLLARLKREHPGLLVFDPTALFCDQKWCYAILDGKLMYRDSNHLSASGTEYVARKLIASLPAATRAAIGVAKETVQ